MGFTGVIVTCGLFVIFVLGLGTHGATTETPGVDMAGEGDGNDTSAVVPDGNVTMVTDGEDAAPVNGTSEGVNETISEPPPDTGPGQPVTDQPTTEKEEEKVTVAKPDVTPVKPETTVTKPPYGFVTRLPFPVVPSVHYVSAGPLCMSNSDCNVTNSERCTTVREGTKRCECLSGHSRASDGNTCVASKVYYVELETEQLISHDLRDHSSNTFRKFKYDATEGAIRALKESKLAAILVDVRVSQLSAGRFGRITIRYEVLLLRSYVPNSVVVTSDIRKAFLDKLVSRPDGNMVLKDTDIPFTASRVQGMQLRDVNPCAHPLLNYCAPSALCVLSARSFTCRCRRGYQDTSPDVLQAPGEQCTLSCGCKNGGECELDDKGVPKCSCRQWYLGHVCGVDVRLLLIVLASVVGFLLLIAVVCCACCLRYWRRRRRQTDDCSSVYSSPRERFHMHKLPPGGRSYYDTWRYYSFGPPQYTSTPGGKWPSMALRPQCPPFLAYKRSTTDGSTPLELVPPGYGTYGPIPRPQVMPSSTLPRAQRSESQWVWSTTGDQESSFA